MLQTLRSLYVWACIGLFTAGMYLAGVPLFLLTFPFDPQRKVGHWYAQRWGRQVLRMNNRWSSEVLHPERIPHDRPVVVIANHQGVGDIMMAYCLDLQFKWISKASNFFVPFMGWFMFHAGYIPLVRGRRSSIAECLAKAQRYLENGVSVLFFPEGSRSADGQVKPFKAGAFRLAVATGCDILPLAITGTFDALPKNTWKFSDDPAKMQLIVGEVISTRGMTEADVPRLIKECREVVCTLKDELEGRTYERPRRAVG